jgi:hypothetical protein
MAQRRRKKEIPLITSRIPIKSIGDILIEKKIKEDKCLEYYNFLIYLLDNLGIEYLGDEIVDEDILMSHFNWLWNKISIGKYKKFHNSDDQRNDLIIKSIFEFVYPAFYLSEREKGESILYLKKIFEKIFILNNSATIIDINTLIDLYEKFTKI